ncbi:response regulator [Stappia sp. GBMRC 2046]|uniref:histidine kinase n=1 Tax=Stappia sediminis TaxID=2692190 RepID=A0A7X3S7R5_9HYPH|nr:response regulator [Stappia sediminis]MXN65071.1 response regulator [Stappia sediminis]
MSDKKPTDIRPHEDDRDRQAALVHDLRTPLSAMRTATEIAMREPMSDTQSQALGTVLEAIDALLAMTTNLLDSARANALERADAGTPNVHALLSGVGRLFGAAAREKGLDFHLRIDGALAGYQVADTAALRRIASVLADNAVKYTDAGSVVLEAKAVADTQSPVLILDVEDSGGGISEDDRSGLFKPYRRGEDAAGRQSGMGLGLWNARHLAAGAGGRLELASTSASGSRFQLTFPIYREKEGSSPGGSQQREMPVPEGGVLPRRVLVVDDNETHRRLLATVLKAFGVDVAIAASGEEALARFEAARDDQRFDVALIDLTMPGMDGFQTLEALRDEEGGRSLPAIAVTAASNADRNALSARGFSAVIEKPVDPAALHRTLETVYSGVKPGG